MKWRRPKRGIHKGDKGTNNEASNNKDNEALNNEALNNEALNNEALNNEALNDKALNDKAPNNVGGRPPKMPYVLAAWPIPATISFLALIALGLWLTYQWMAWDEIDGLPNASNKAMVQEDGRLIGWSRRDWLAGEGLIDPRGKPWRIIHANGTKISVVADTTLFCKDSDPVSSPDLLPALLSVPQAGEKFRVVVIQQGWEDATTGQWKSALTRQGIDADFLFIEGPFRRRTIRDVANQGPAATILVHAGGTCGWQDPDGVERVQFFIEDDHPRHPSNLSFALRWSECLPDNLKPSITICRRSQGQHLSPRVIDLVLPQENSPYTIEQLAEGLAKALEPDFLTNVNQSVIMSRRIGDARRPGN